MQLKVDILFGASSLMRRGFFKVISSSFLKNSLPTLSTRTKGGQKPGRYEQGKDLKSGINTCMYVH